MKILINCSNLKKGGGLQVADSVCRQLGKYANHSFIVVLSDALENTASIIDSYQNVKVIKYNAYASIKAFVTSRDKTLDSLVESYSVDAVLSLFGPILWVPKCLHISGFARAHLVLTDSPYFKRMSKWKLLKNKIQNFLLKYIFDRTANVYFTENPMISERLQKLFPKKIIHTVTNYYNQVFDQPDSQKEHLLPQFSGVTLLSVNSQYPHKNMEIAIDVARILRKEYPKFKFRFVMTIDREDYPCIEQDMENNFCFIGKVDVYECPSLYRQTDICFQPTLLECFTATYAEAMRMKVPIVTTDLSFAKGLCGNAAEYYSAINPQAAADAIYRIATSAEMRNNLISAGCEQLKTFDNYNERADKMIKIVESEFKK